MSVHKAHPPTGTVVGAGEDLRVVSGNPTPEELAAVVMGLLEEARLARMRGFKVAQKAGSVHSAFGRVKDWFVGNF